MNAAVEDIVGQVLDPVFRDLPEEAARKIAALQADESWQRRVEELADKSNEGTLTAEEKREYASLVEAGDILAILQAVARRRTGTE